MTTDKIKLGNNEVFKQKEEKQKTNISLSNTPDITKQIKGFEIATNGASYFVNGFNKK